MTDQRRSPSNEGYSPTTHNEDPSPRSALQGSSSGGGVAPSPAGFWGALDAWLDRARWLIVPYWLMLGLGVVLGTVMVGYALAHGAGEMYVPVVLGLLAALGTPALLLLLRSRGLVVRVLRLTGLGVMLAALCGVVAIWWQVSGEARWWTWQFERAMRGVSVPSASHRPLLVDGVQVGIELNMQVRLKHPVPLDRYGLVLRNAFMQPMVLAQAPDSWSLWSHLRLATQVRLDGRPLAELGSEALPAGNYEVMALFHYWGLREISPTNHGWCLDLAPALMESRIKSNQPLSGLPTRAQLRITLDLEKRRGRHTIVREARMPPAYDHAAWMARLPTLPYAPCEEHDARSREEERQRRAAEDARIQYDRHREGTLPLEELDIYREACAGDLDGVKRRMAAETTYGKAWVPRFRVANLLQNCAVAAGRTDLMELLAPHAVEQEAGRTWDSLWCPLVMHLHRTHHLPMLEALLRADIPLDCPGRELWRSGMVPPGTRWRPEAEPLQSKALTDWLALLRRARLDLCTPATDQRDRFFPGDTLLDVAVREFPAEQVAFAVKLGCPVPAKRPEVYWPHRDLPLALHWVFRRHGAKEFVPVPDADPQLLAQVDAALRPLAADINRPRFSDGSTLLHMYSSAILQSRDPILLRRLADAGAKLDAADEQGRSWLDWGTGSFGFDPEAAAVALGALTTAQLEQLLQPRNIVDGRPGQPLQALRPVFRDAPNPMRLEMCARGLLHCAATSR